MDPSLILTNPPLTVLTMIHYMKGREIRITGKNALFIQIEFASQIYTFPFTELRDLCDDLWDTATFEQRRMFDIMANKFNLIRNKSRIYRQSRKNQGIIGGFGLNYRS